MLHHRTRLVFPNNKEIAFGELSMDCKKNAGHERLAGVVRLVFDELAAIESQVKATRAAFLDALRDAGIEPTTVIPELRRTKRTRRPAAAR